MEDEDEDYLNLLYSVKQDILSVRSNIRVLKDKLEKLYLKEYLLKHGSESPKIISAQDELQDYKYIDKPVTLAELNITLYPLWLEMICFHPQWSTDIYSVKVKWLSPNDNSKDAEVLIDAIATILNISYEQAEKVFSNNSLIRLPRILYSEYYNTTNFSIDWKRGELLQDDQYNDINFGLDIKGRMINTIKFKYILIMSNNNNV